MLPYINQVQGCKFEALVWKSKKIIVYQSACLGWRFSIMENLGEDGCGDFSQDDWEMNKANLATCYLPDGARMYDLMLMESKAKRCL